MAADDEEYYGYFYGSEEDRGLLDPAWERQQRKVRSRKRCKKPIVTRTYHHGLQNRTKLLHDRFSFSVITTTIIVPKIMLDILLCVCFLRRSLRGAILI